MKIRTPYGNKFPKSKHVVEWITTTEVCNENSYQFRVKQEHQPENWFRNLKVLAVVEATAYSNLKYLQYTIQYERKHEYWEVDISSSAMTAILRDDPDLGVVHRDGALWLDYVGD